jgi:hypothetical protein
MISSRCFYKGIKTESFKTWFGNSAKVFVLSFCSCLCSFVHGARSMKTLYFSTMNESSNTNVSVQSFNHACYLNINKPKTKDVHSVQCTAQHKLPAHYNHFEVYWVSRPCLERLCLKGQLRRQHFKLESGTTDTSIVYNIIIVLIQNSPIISISILANSNKGLTLFLNILGACLLPPYGLIKINNLFGLFRSMDSS